VPEKLPQACHRDSWFIPSITRLLVRQAAALSQYRCRRTVAYLESR